MLRHNQIQLPQQHNVSQIFLAHSSAMSDQPTWYPDADYAPENLLSGPLDYHCYAPGFDTTELAIMLARPIDAGRVGVSVNETHLSKFGTPSAVMDHVWVWPLHGDKSDVSWFGHTVNTYTPRMISVNMMLEYVAPVYFSPFCIVREIRFAQDYARVDSSESLDKMCARSCAVDVFVILSDYFAMFYSPRTPSVDQDTLPPPPPPRRDDVSVGWDASEDESPGIDTYDLPPLDGDWSVEAHELASMPDADASMYSHWTLPAHEPIPDAKEPLPADVPIPDTKEPLPADVPIPNTKDKPATPVVKRIQNSMDVLLSSGLFSRRSLDFLQQINLGATTARAALPSPSAGV